jgi:aromatic ring-opening dioxygenase catalytic subunit (LigB family)
LDFWLFGHGTTLLVGQTSDESEQLLEAITESLNEIHPAEVVAISRHWAERVRWVFEKNGDYYHE